MPPPGHAAASDAHAGHHTAHNGHASSSLAFKVDGMMCASCAATVQRAIETQPGVRSAAVNVIDGRALVEGERLDAAAIARSITDHGYPAEAVDQAAAPDELRSEIEQRQGEHERLWKRRAIIGLGVWAPMESLHWIGVAAGWHEGHGAGWMEWLMFAGSTAVMIAAGGGFYRSAIAAGRRGTTNMDTLIAMGATAAYVFSLVVFIARLFGGLHDQPLYFAEAAALLGIISLGHYLEARATAKAGSAIRELLQLQPDEAEVFDQPHSSGSAVSTAPRFKRSADVQPGDHLLIRPGARVPVDGVVVDGESDVDEAVVTGESIPVHKHSGSEVIAGSINTSGSLIVKATVDGRHTTISRIAAMVQQAQTSKANIQKLADRVSAVFVPTVLVIALLTIVGWSVAGDFATGVIAMCTVLIISCPCALGLATPMAVMVGAGAASRRGILVKSAMALETAGRAKHVIFDKTGTLTVGRPSVTTIETAANRTERDVLRLAAAVEAASEHPIGRAIVEAARQRDLHVPAATKFRAIPGQGVRGDAEGRSIEVLRDPDGAATCIVLIDGQRAGAITIIDQPREDAREAITRLRAMGVSVTMLSGDRRAAALTIGERIGMREDEIVAEANPQQKVEFVSRTKSGNQRAGGGAVIMVGDGVNDAAALAAADLGVAMASGTNIAIESADVVIPGDHVNAVAHTIDLSRQTLRTIKQNLFFAFFYNAAAIPAAAFGLLGPYGPLIAAMAMGFSDITVVGNALRLKAKLARR